jgi:CBS domain-containing protein
MPLRIKDIMSTDIKSIPPDINAKEALKLLIETGMSGFPVIDAAGEAIGVFTEKEILSAILPSYIKAVGSFVYTADSKAELKKLAALEKVPVKDLMRKEVPAIDIEATLTEASKMMLTRSERRLIVVSGKKAVGVVTRSDVVTALAKEAEVAL